MANLLEIFSLILLASILFSISSAKEAKSITEECKNRCERSYPPHTYPKKETHSACLRGCRLSAIGQLSSSNRSKENASKACIAGCIEGYSDKDSQFACKVGCNEQPIIPTPEALFKKQMSFGSWSVSGYTRVEPFMVARQYCHGLIRRITYYVKTSTAFYSSTQGGKTYVVKVHGPPQIFASVSDAEKASQDEASQVKIHLEKREHYDHDHHHHHGYAWKAIDKSKAWLHCVSRRSGLPFWLLTSVLFMGFTFLLWLCCSSVGSSNRNQKEKRLLVDDIYLLDGDDIISKKTPLLKSDEEGPLPLKVNISATTI